MVALALATVALALGHGDENQQHPFVLERSSIAGRSAQGRPIRLHEYGEPPLRGEVMVFGCIHGDECGMRGIQPLDNGCPPPGVDIFVVPDLDPDGSVAGSRLNANGVDLNRNFPAAWEPSGAPGDLEHSGAHPFSEPESRLAARLIRKVGPAVTIWFHQQRGLRRPYVRAWGESVPAGRRFARLAGTGFRALPWLPGTAPHWQNRTFPDSAAFVVEFPRGRVPAGWQRSVERGILRLARAERENRGYGG